MTPNPQISSSRIQAAARTLRSVHPATWPPTLLWAAGIGLLCLVALANLPHSAWATASGIDVKEPVLAAEASTVAVPAKSRGRARCESCGVVEAIRRIEATGRNPTAYEFTVRLRNGSTRVSTVAQDFAPRWVVGDTIMLIGGSSPKAN